MDAETKLTREDRTEMRLVAVTALGIFPRVAIDPAHLLALLDTVDALDAALTELVERRERACRDTGYMPLDGTDGRYARARAALARARGTEAP